MKNAVCMLVAVLLVAAPSAVAKPEQPIAPFVYEFRVVGFSATATLTYATTSATIKYRLLKPSIARTVAYLPRSGSRIRFAAPIVDVVAQATYTSPDPSCTGRTIQYRPAGNKIVQVYVGLDPLSGTVRRVKSEVTRIPLAIPFPGQDGVGTEGLEPLPRCGRPEMGHWYQDMEGFAPVRLLSRPRVTISGRDSTQFTDEGIESIEWSLDVTLQRLKYRPIDCAKHPGC